jgi:hypothetical protein
MPRVTTQQYIERHNLLRQVWLRDEGRFACLPAKEQWELHAYYVPSKDLTGEQLLEHRALITKEQPSLSNKAGKAFAALSRGDTRGVIYGSPMTRGKYKGRRISVRAVARPEPDFKNLAQALIDMAREKMEREKAS